MRTAISKAEQLVTDLDRDLGASTGPWLFGDRFPPADLFWAVSLYRFLWLGYSGFWKDGAGKPRVEAYANRLFARPSGKDAIIQWPGHPPRETVKRRRASGRDRMCQYGSIGVVGVYLKKNTLNTKQ